MYIYCCYGAPSKLDPGSCAGSLELTRGVSQRVLARLLGIICIYVV